MQGNFFLQFINIFKSILDQLHVFFTIKRIFFQLGKLFIRKFFTEFVTLDPDPPKNKYGSTALPTEFNALNAIVVKITIRA